MGATNRKVKSIPELKLSEIQEFSKQSLFPPDDIKALYFHFHRIQSSQIDDGVIDYSEFCLTLKKPTDAVMPERIFQMFDANQDGVINFREFLLGLSSFNEYIGTNRMLSTSKLHEKIEVSFRMLDPEQNKKIYFKYFKHLLKAALKESLGVRFRNRDVKHIIQRTWADLDVEEDTHGQFIDKDTYKKMLILNPPITKWLCADLERVHLGVRDRKLKTKQARCLSV